MENPTENNRKPDQRAGCAVAVGSALTRETVWNGWTSNYRGGGYITHACREIGPRVLKSICGAAPIVDSGLLTLADDWEPGCIKCRRALRKLGLLPPNINQL